MEIALVSSSCIKLRGKQASLVIHPDASAKTAADGVLVFDTTPINDSKIEGSRLTVQGIGEYEVGGIKISAGGNKEAGFIYTVKIDGLEVLIAKTGALEKEQDKLKESDVMVLRCDGSINQSVIPAISPKLLVLFGEKCEEIVKSLGKENSTPVSKVQVTADKLPIEMEVTVLE